MQEETIGSSENNEFRNISNKWRNLLAALKKMNLKIFQINDGGDYWQL